MAGELIIHLLRLLDKMGECNCNIKLPRIERILACGKVIYRKRLIYFPSNSKKGIPIKGTNLRVEFEYY